MAAAQAAAGQGAAGWTLSSPWDRDDPLAPDEDGELPICRDSCAVFAGDEVMIYDEGTPSVQEAQHIARHDPARVLREVAAKRAVLDAYRAERDGGFGGSGFTEGLEFTLRHAAVAWDDHPGYREEWRPQ
jgi:hypothetical protein